MEARASRSLRYFVLQSDNLLLQFWREVTCIIAACCTGPVRKLPICPPGACRMPATAVLGMVVSGWSPGNPSRRGLGA